LIRVAYLIDTIACDTAGTQKQLLETIARLDRRRFAPFLICLRKSEWMRSHRLPCPCQVLGYGGFLDANFLGVVQKLIRHISDARIDIVQTFFEDSIFVGSLGARLGRRRPVLISSRRDMGLGYRNQPWYHKLYPAALWVVNRFFDGIIANSRNVRAYAAKRERVSPDKIAVIYNGIELPTRPDEAPMLFREYTADIWIGIAASLTPVKRHDVLLKAFAKLLREVGGKSIRLVILGEGAERRSLETMARELGLEERVHFEGAVRDVFTYLYQFDIGVLCSDREGLSNAILEYMACGLPVVATSVGGNTELVSETSGICVPPGDERALAAALASLCVDSERRRRMGKQALSTVEARFSWRRCMRDLEAYYEFRTGR
jgi:glycosyltransferase involved in cell wall biosynthesis